MGKRQKRRMEMVIRRIGKQKKMDVELRMGMR